MEVHRTCHEDRKRWQSMKVGQAVSVVKLSPGGDEAARYPAMVAECTLEENWIALRARWTYQRVEIDGLVFEPGDELIEWFSPIKPFNAFAVLSPTGTLRGWYANVTYPAYLEPAHRNGRSPALVWHDLYLDLVGQPDGTFVTRDEDELAESGLATSDPVLHNEIVAAADELARRFTSRRMPFRLVDTKSAHHFDPRQSQNESD